MHRHPLPTAHSYRKGPDRIDIAERPQIVNERTRIGDREGDTVYGQNVSLVALVERTSHFTLCGQNQTKCKDEVASALTGFFDTITERKETLTPGSGSEFTAHAKINKRHSIDIFLQSHTQAGREEQMKILMADSEESGQKK